MKKFLLAGIAAASFCGASAIAADMPVKAPVYKAAPAPVFSWTGCNIGANVGGAWAHHDAFWATEISPTPGPVNEPQGSLTASGWAYGGQVGCDYQFNNNWVVGIRGMWDGSSMKGSRLAPPLNIGNFTDQFDHDKIGSFGTLTGQLGFLVNPAVMVYGLGGIAWTRDHFSITDALAGGEVASIKQSWTGYDVGAGLSWMFAPNWNLWIEYDHMGFGTRNATLVLERVVAGAVNGFRMKENVDKVLVGINYRFGDWGKTPVVAKY
jgi:outer membrane immunogenic protein